MSLITAIVPCYNEEEVLPLFYDSMCKMIAGMQSTFSDVEWELLFVNDGSKDKTLLTLREMALKDKRVRYVSFSRNFGKEAAMYAGLQNAKGDYVVIMDADLQHPPERIPEMYGYVNAGEYDMVATRRTTRAGEPPIRSWFAKQFYKIINKVSQTEIVDGALDFRFMTRQVADSILSMPEYNRFIKGIFSWVGYRVKYLEHENIERAAGTTQWSFWKLFLYAIEGVCAFSTAPLAISAIAGVFLGVVGFLLLIVGIIAVTASGNDLSTMFIISVLFMLFGIQLFCTGILGEYLAKTYMEVKNRPIYISQETEEDIRKKNQQ